MNVYGYVNANPLTRYDFLGQLSVWFGKVHRIVIEDTRVDSVTTHATLDKHPQLAYDEVIGAVRGKVVIQCETDECEALKKYRFITLNVEYSGTVNIPLYDDPLSDVPWNLFRYARIIPFLKPLAAAESLNSKYNEYVYGLYTEAFSSVLCNTFSNLDNSTLEERYGDGPVTL